MALVPFPNQATKKASDEEPDWDEPEGQLEDGSGGKMSFLEHLDELRRRIMWAVISLAGGIIIGLFFITQIFDFVMRPMQQLLPAGQTLIFTEPSEAFTLYIKIACIAGLIIASPAVMAQVWLFIAPGLYANEKKLAIPFVLMSSTFFIMGTAFSHYVVFPLTWQFFVGFTSDILTFTPRVEPSFSLYFKLLLSFGLVFQMPTVVLFLARMGMITARFMLKNFKYAVLIIFVAAAVLTPDGSPWTQTAMAIPMLLLYLFSVGLAWLFGKKKRVEE